VLGKRRPIEGIYYRGEVKVNVAQFAPDEIVGVYEGSMKIDQTFKSSRWYMAFKKASHK
jgi:hypothetical protein